MQEDLWSLSVQNNTTLIDASDWQHSISSNQEKGVLKTYHLHHSSQSQSSALLNISRVHSVWVEVWPPVWRQARRYVGLTPAPSFSQALQRGTSGWSSGCRSLQRCRQRCQTASAHCLVPSVTPRSREAEGKSNCHYPRPNLRSMRSLCVFHSPEWRHCAV